MRRRTLLMLTIVLLAPAANAGAVDAGAKPPAAREAPTLTLFELDLQTVTAAKLGDAIRKAGGKPKKGDAYDVTAIGLPGIHTLELTFHRGQFVAAVYQGGGQAAGTEKLRKMLVEKYGDPVWHTGPGFGDTTKRPAKGFTDRFVSDGKFGWDFAGGMQLVFKSGSFGSFELTYIDPARFAELKKVAADADASDARSEARKKSHAF